MVTDTARPPATNTQTHRRDRLQYTAPLASAQCIIKIKTKSKQFTKSKLHHIKVKMMSNQTVHKLTISLLNYLINMIKSDTNLITVQFSVAEL